MSSPDPVATPRAITLLGATGSIGRSTLDVVRAWPGRFRVEALVAGCQWEVLLEQIHEFHPRFVSLADADAARSLREALAASGRSGNGSEPVPDVLDGESAATEIAALDGVDLVVNGLVGSRGLLPTLAALRRGVSVAIANKEPLVVAGELVMEAARAGQAELLPLDSELSAIHQCLRGNADREARRVLLTASGGPFRDLGADQFAAIDRDAALSHPTWDMGPKITVDSATLMNKGLEIIETHHYFGLPYDRIEVVIHPQSLVHSMVEFADSSVMAQISVPDMRLPIQYALTHPERLPSPVPRLDLARVGQLTFEEPDLTRFPCLWLARQAGEAGGVAPAILNAANEVAVQAFLDRKILFTEIPEVVETCLERGDSSREPTLENFQEIDGFTRLEAQGLVEARAVGSPTPRHA